MITKILDGNRSLSMLATLALCGTAWSSLSAAPGSTDWPRWRGPGNDGISTESGWLSKWPEAGPKALWTVKVGVGFSAVSVADGRVYTMGNADGKDVVWCLDAGTGKEIWTHRYECAPGGGGYPGPRVTPTVDGDFVYTLSNVGHLFCLGAKDGKVLWSKQVVQDFGVKPNGSGWGLACSPLVLGDKLILDLGKAIALDTKTGNLIWNSGSDMAGFSSPTTIEVGGATYINCFTAFGLVLVSAADGKELARTRWETSYDVNSASPIPSGDKVFISSGYGKGCGLFQIKDGALSPVYTNKEMRNHCNSCVLYKGHLYGIDGQMGSRGRLACLDFETGAVKWEDKSFKAGGLMLAGGKLIVMSDGGELSIVEATPEAFKPLAKAKVLQGQCWTYPVLSGGRIYCRSNKEGQLVCLDVSGK